MPGIIPSLFQYDSSMPALGHISKLARSTKNNAERYRGMRLLFAERCCEMRSARRAKLQHAGLAQSEQVWCWGLDQLLCRVAAQQAEGSSRTSRLVRTRIRRPESRGAKLRGAVSSARRLKLLSVCHVRGDQQEAPAFSLL